jgi:HTH-type transcriptional regulator, sugar sensing transcriptional regulator
MENLIQNLSNVGIPEKEARVYIALLQLGKASAYSISERSGLKKATTYVILDELIKKGLVTKIPRVKKQQYIAKPPEEFFAAAEERLKQAKKALPELITMAESEKVKVQTLFYEGIKGIENALDFHTKEMKGKELVGFYATAEDASKELMNVFTPWPKKMKDAGVTVKVITPQDVSTKDFLEMDKQLGHQIKSIPKQIYSSKVSLEAGEDFVRIILFKPLQALIIKSPELSQSVKQVFEMVWNQKQ